MTKEEKILESLKATVCYDEKKIYLRDQISIDSINTLNENGWDVVQCTSILGGKTEAYCTEQEILDNYNPNSRTCIHFNNDFF